MLVLTRKAGEAIRIQDDIIIKIISTDKNGIRIGIEAPNDVTILREELYEAVAEENRKAVKPASEVDLAILKNKLG